MNGIKAPASATLENPHNIGRNIEDARSSFWELARSRTTYRTQAEHIAFEQALFGEDWEISSAIYVQSLRRSGNENDPELWVTKLEISINRDFFGDENADLIPYAVEHEIFEAWLWAKRGIKPQSATANHLLARRRQLEMAMIDGKAEKLVEFYRKETPEFASEFDYAYEATKRKVKVI